ncbi:MAG: hypothetical protein GX639_22545, partial [Fibrobacter sp.]|nr:hypothetical protein [Fibrobacter sp.]
MSTPGLTRTTRHIAQGAQPGAAAASSAMPFTGTLLPAYVVAVVLFSAYPGLSLIATGVGFALAFVFAVEVVVQGQKLHFPFPVIMALLFGCFCILQMIWAPGSTAMVLTVTQLLILFVIIVNYCMLTKTDHRIEIAVYLSVILTFVYLAVSDVNAQDGRVSSTIGNANEYSIVLLLGILFALRRLLYASVIHKISIKIMIALLLYIGLSIYGVIYLTGSRMGLILTITAIALMAMYWVWLQPVWRRIWLVIVVA